jgi:hypothetical protein
MMHGQKTIKLNLVLRLRFRIFSKVIESQPYKTEVTNPPLKINYFQ